MLCGSLVGSLYIFPGRPADQLERREVGSSQSWSPFISAVAARVAVANPSTATLHFKTELVRFADRAGESDKDAPIYVAVVTYQSHGASDRGHWEIFKDRKYKTWSAVAEDAVTCQACVTTKDQAEKVVELLRKDFKKATSRELPPVNLPDTWAGRSSETGPSIGLEEVAEFLQRVVWTSSVQHLPVRLLNTSCRTTQVTDIYFHAGDYSKTDTILQPLQALYSWTYVFPIGSVHDSPLAPTRGEVEATRRVVQSRLNSSDGLLHWSGYVALRRIGATLALIVFCASYNGPVVSSDMQWTEWEDALLANHCQLTWSTELPEAHRRTLTPSVGAAEQSVGSPLTSPYQSNQKPRCYLWPVNRSDKLQGRDVHGLANLYHELLENFGLNAGEIPAFDKKRHGAGLLPSELARIISDVRPPQ